MKNIKLRAHGLERSNQLEYFKSLKELMVSLDMNWEEPTLFELSTEVLDVKGKEIYEGDIIIDLDVDRMSGIFREVSYHEGIYISSNGHPPENRMISGDVIIVGNIHENPELMERNNE